MIYGDLPTKRVVYAACDKKYFHEHAPSLVYSLNDIGKDKEQDYSYIYSI